MNCGGIMELRVLRYYLTVAREENITKAAELLHITQPTLSRQLALLEEETGVQLFTRGSRRITLTEEGLLLKHRAEEILALADQTMEDLQVREDHIFGTVSIGTGGLAANLVILRMAQEFRQKYPEVQFSVYTGTADLVQERMDRGLIDFGVLLEPVNVEKYNFIRLKQKERWCVLLKADDPLAQKEAVTREDLRKRSLVLPERSGARSEVLNWFDCDIRKLHADYTSNLSTTAAQAVMCTDAAALILDGALDYLDQSILVKRPLSPALESGTVIAWKKDLVQNAAKEKFLEVLSALSGNY